MLFFAITVFFSWLAITEINNPGKKDALSWGYTTICITLAALSVYPVYSKKNFEHKLTEITRELAQNPTADVECQSAVASIFDRSSIRSIGYANPATGEVTIKTYWCKRLKSYIRNPDTDDQQVQYSVMLLVHEAMHVRGEYNEQKTECQAIQRHVRTAMMLGAPRDTALEQAHDYYTRNYSRHPYYSNKCLPGSQWDEQLADSSWWLESADYKEFYVKGE